MKLPSSICSSVLTKMHKFTPEQKLVIETLEWGKQRMKLLETLYYYDGPLLGLFLTDNGTRLLGMAMPAEDYGLDEREHDPWFLSAITEQQWNELAADASTDTLLAGDYLRNMMIAAGRYFYCKKSDGELFPCSLNWDALPTAQEEVDERRKMLEELRANSKEVK
jgi:hypothetical protein